MVMKQLATLFTFGKAGPTLLLMLITFSAVGQRVGIGTALPEADLHLRGGANANFLIQNINGIGASEIEIKSSTTANESLKISHINTNNAGTRAGVPIAGLSSLITGLNNTGGLMLGTGNNAPFYIITNNLRRLTLSESGNLAIGNSNPNASALLDLQGNSGGLLLPRLTTTQRNAIASPANGLLVYNTTTNSLNYFKTGDGWTEVGAGGGGGDAWLTTGNLAAPVGAALGTFNQEPLRFRVGGQPSGMFWYDAEANTFAGYASGVLNQTANANNSANTGLGTSTLTGLTTGSRNTAVGTEAGFAVSTGQRNVFVGRQAGWQTTTQSGNVALGSSALYHAKGNDNIAIGDSAYFGAASGTASAPNIAIGKRALASATTAGSNLVIGRIAFSNVTTASQNTIIGNNAFSSNSSTNGGQHNIAIGANVMFSANGGSFNIAMNNFSLRNNTGDHNIALGASSLWNNTSGNRNIALGHLSLAASTTASQQIAIGDSALYTYNGTEEGNVAVGGRAGWQLTNNGTQNTLIGRYALKDGLFTNKNVAIGYEAGNIIQGGGSNVFVGHIASAKNNLASGSTAIGAEASAGFSNSTAIGFQASVTGSNRMAFGNESVTNWIFGRTTVTAGRALEVGTNNTNGNGAYLTTGGTWTNNSDINLKEDITKLSAQDILQKIAGMSITRWKYKGTNEYHIGPMAQDFYAAFQTGTDNKSISSIDPAGVSLLAIQALMEKIEALEIEIIALKNK
jgi:hypothetical protein